MRDSLFNAWSDIEQLSHEEIVSRYLEILKKDIKGGISCILGFSYGGELAYHLATGGKYIPVKNRWC